MRYLTSILLLSFTLSACGGGGSSSGSSSGHSVGVKSSHTNAVTALRDAILNDATFSAALTAEQATEFRTHSTGALIGSYSNGFAATQDTNAEAAWHMGWTGKSVKLGIIDTFDTESSYDTSPFGTDEIQITHGEEVEMVARQVAPEARFNRWQGEAPSLGPQFVPALLAAVADMTEDGWNIINISAGRERVQDIDDDNLDHAVNVSAAEWQRQIDELTAAASFLPLAGPSTRRNALNRNALAVFAAGNSGAESEPEEPDETPDEACTSGLNGCNLLAAAIHELRESGETNAGDRVLFVGALTHGTDTIAPYSVRAGEMTGDFIVAGERAFRADDPLGVGTSFATPRVVGAAALVRHKFPNLNGPQLKQVLIRSADDLGADGPDEIYGAGKLNVISALSPIDGLTR